ncbi:unnamed protein product [Camellia sinensis]
MKLGDGFENDVKSGSSSSRRADNREVLSNIADNQSNEMVNKFDELKPPNRIAHGSQRSGSFSGWRSGEGGELDGFWRNP